MYHKDYSYTILKDLSRIEESKWDNLLNQSPYASPFQTPGFFTFTASNDGTEPFIIVVASGEEYVGVVTGTVIKEKGFSSFFSRRAIIEGGIILEGKNNDAVVDLILHSLSELLSRKVIYLEIRNYNDYSYFKPVFEKNGFEYLPYLNYHVNCTDEAKMRTQINKGKWRQINGSLKSGAKIIIPDSDDQVLEFYNILSTLYRNRVKKPLPSWEFFRDFRNSGLGTYLLVSFDDMIIGGIMCPFDKNAIFEWYVAGMDNRFEKIYPSILATYAAMEFACKNDIPRFDFMGAGQPSQDYGVRDFKSRFGGELVEHGRFRKIFNPLLFKAGVTGLKILSKIK